VSRATLPGGLDEQATALLEAHWREPGFCVPNAATYPWQWLWDSCFHAVCWAHLDRPDRAVTELEHALAHQSPAGFVPHLTYWGDGSVHAGFWGRPGTSSITQPPMYGHALAELHRRGVVVPDDLVERASRGLRHLLAVRDRPGVGPVILHPWESGCDDSARWDAWCPPPWTFIRWKEQKGELVAALLPGPARGLAAGEGPAGSTRFEVASAGFAALVAFNARELAVVTGDAGLVAAADAVARLLAARWDPVRRVWADAVVIGPDATATVATLDALLPTLVVADDEAAAAALADIVDDDAYGGRYGPPATRRDEPTYDPTAYWRGPAWPQLTYLCWVAATRRGDGATADWLAGRLVAGARRSGFAEYWHPDTGQGLGALPQTWTALAAVVAGQAPRA
jgi:hypothetical protein